MTASAKFQYWDTTRQDFYPAYSKAQTLRANRRWNMVWAKEEEIATLSSWLRETFGRPNLTGLCHGVRNGQEVRWLRHYLPDATIIGTEISPLGQQTPGVERWDFHDPNPCWRHQCNFVYSNSLDHAYDARLALTAWLEALTDDGVVLLHVNPSDFFNPNPSLTAHDCYRPAKDDFEALLSELGKFDTVQRIFHAGRVVYALRRV